MTVVAHVRLCESLPVTVSESDWIGWGGSVEIYGQIRLYRREVYRDAESVTVYARGQVPLVSLSGSFCVEVGLVRLSVTPVR